MPHTEGHEPTTLDDLEQLWMQGAAQQPELQDVIGGYYAFDSPVPIGPLRAGRQTRKAYKAGDDMSTIAKMNTERLARFQQTAVSTGLVREVVPGRIDDNTVKAMNTLMALGNRQGVEWQDVLDGVVKAGGLPEGQEPEFEPEPYLAPDTAYYAQLVKQKFRQDLGRDPDESELAEMTAELGGWDKLAFEREQELRQIQHEEATGQGMTVESIDPLARFHERFEKVYSGELDIIEAREEASEVQEITGNTVNRLSTMARGEF